LRLLVDPQGKNCGSGGIVDAGHPLVASLLGPNRNVITGTIGIGSGIYQYRGNFLALELEGKR
jgi:hypothetical protein